MLSIRRVSYLTLLLLVASCIVISTTVAEDTLLVQADDESAAIKWIRNTAVPVRTTDPKASNEELMFLKGIIGDARIVSLGEATHGTSEFFRMKHRLVRFLVEEAGFTHFGIEASLPDCKAISDYILLGTGDPEEALHKQGFWTWDTEELLALIKWMRRHNESSADTVRFIGYDMQNPRKAARVAVEFAEAADSGSARILRQQFDTLFQDKVSNFWQVYEDYSLDERTSFRDFAELLANTIDRHQDTDLTAPTGIEWSQARLHASVVGQCEAMMRIEKQFQPSIGVLEWYRIYGSLAESAAELADYLSRVSTTGSDSLVGFLATIQEPDVFVTYENLPTDQERQKWKDLSQAILTDLESNRERYAKDRGDSAFGVSRSAAQDIVLAWQCLDEYAAMPDKRPNVRDQAMAENVSWVLDQAGSDAKIVLWAHNLHVMKQTEDPGYGSMGSELERVFCDDHYVIGFSFNQGSFQAAFMDVDSGGNYIQRLGPFAVETAEKGTIPWTLAQADLPLYFLDLSSTMSDEATSWLLTERPMRAIGAGYSYDDVQKYFEPVVLPERFDAVIFVDSTSAAKPNPRTRERFGISD